MRASRLFFIVLGTVFFSFIQHLAAQQPNSSNQLSIVRITPSGDDVAASREITFQFDRPVVALGKMDRSAQEIPISIEPTLACEWRWLNTTTLACQLGEKTALSPSTRYKITVQPKITTLDGVAMAGVVEHTFTTQRPKINYTWFEKWRSPSHPTIYVVFNQTLDPKSVADHLYLKAENNSRYELVVEPIPNAGEDRWKVFPKDELPLDSITQLVVEPGIRPRTGNELGAENRVVVQFATFPAFSLLGVTCWPNNKGGVQSSTDDVQDEEGGEADYYDTSFNNFGSGGGLKPLFFPIGTPLDISKRCNPMNAIALTFSAPVEKDDVKDHFTFTPDLTGGRTDFDPWEEVYSYNSYYDPHQKGERYYLPLPYPLKAFDTYTVENDAGKVKDAFGRILSNSGAIQFSTDHRPPRFHLANQVSVMESGVDSQLPLIVTNLGAVNAQYEKLTSAGLSAENQSSIELFPAQDIAYPIPVKVRDFLGGKSGLVQGHITASAGEFHGSNWFFSEVTPFDVHIKVGHFNSLAWVTRFSDGLPVKGAKVSFYRGRIIALSENTPLGASALTDSNGLAMLPGTSQIDPQLELINQWNRSNPNLFAKVELNDEIAVVPLMYNFSVTDAMYPSLRKKFGHIHTWGTTAQGIYRLGDRMQFKIFVRDQNVKTFVAAPKGEYHLKVIDPTGRTVFERKNIKLSEFGAFDGELELSKSWSVGYYNFSLQSSFSKETWSPLSVLVSDFTPAPFKVTTEINGSAFQPGDKIEITSQAALHAGGPYSDAPIRVTSLLNSDSVSFDNTATSGFEFGGGDYISDKQLYQIENKMDAKGLYETSFRLEEIKDFVFGKLLIESAVRDDRGRYVASNKSVNYFGRDRFLGLRHAGWIVEQDKPATVDALVVNQEGAIVTDVDISISLQHQVVKASKVKGAGNAYVSEYTTEWVEEDSCKVLSGSGPVSCQLTPRLPGSYKFIGIIQDSKGREHKTELSRWGSGRGFVLWSTSEGNSLDIIPDKNRYKIGDTAKYFIQNPFPGATALVSLERYGILKQWTTTLKESTEIIEVPITEDLIPGFYLSVVVVSPRVEKPIEGKVDLGKPSFKVGYLEVPVDDPLKELEVRISTDKEIYKPRETVEVSLQGSARDGSKDSIEYAVAVLDESVFDLLSRGREAFDPYQGFYSLDGLDVKNYNLLRALIGRQKFERKGANPGGGGGSEMDLRSVFKFVSYWNPSVKADAHGKASVRFQIPDNLTGWRVLAIAVTKGDKMGLGDSVFKSNRPTEVRPALPNQVIEGDSFTANFTVMNRTDSARTLEVKIKADGVIEKPSEAVQTVSLEPFKRQIVSLTLKAVHDGEISFAVTAGDSVDRDGMKVTLPVLKAKALESAATYGTTTSDVVKERVSIPEGIRTDVGELNVVSSPSVIGGLDKVFEYIRDYPYLCWEQRLTKAIMASHYLNLVSYLPKSVRWDNARTVVNQMLQDAESFQAPNGGMCFYAARNEYVNHYLSAYTALGFNWLAARGEKVPEKVEQKLHEFLLEFLRKDVMPEFYTKGMASSVRAVALSALAERKKIGIEDLKRYYPHLSEMDLFGKAHFLKALSYVAGTQEMQKTVVDALLGSSNETGGKLIFTEAVDTGYQRILHSIPRTSCSVVSSLLTARKEHAPGVTLSDDLFFKMIRPITEYRKSKGHWENTQESVFCLNTFVDYSKQFESVTPKLSFSVSFENEKLGSGKFDSYRDEPLELSRDIKDGDAGREGSLSIERKGEGRLYYAARLNYSPKALKTKAINSGIEVKREYSVERDGQWELLSSPFKIKVGELVRVDLYISIPAARNFVVVDDPVPGGLEPVNRDLATASIVDAKKGEFKRNHSSFWFSHDDWVQFGIALWGFYHQELRHSAVRFYSEYLAPGNYHLSYTAQAIAPGTFSVLPLHVEEMYDPDVFGQGVPEELDVEAVAH